MALTKISTDGVKDDAVTAGKITGNAVGSVELADNAVDTNAIQDDAVTRAKIVDNAINVNKIADGQVTTSKIGDGSVNNQKIGNNQVTAGKLASNAVTTAKIADEAVTLAKLPHGDGSSDGKFLRANNGADPTFETVSGTTINNNADNRLITGSGTANTLNGESNLTFDGSLLHVSGQNNGANLSALRIQNSGGSQNTEVRMEFGLSSLVTGYISQTHDSGDTGSFIFANKSSSGAAPTQKMRINKDGYVSIGSHSPSAKLHIDTSHYVVTNSGISTTGIHLDGNAGNAGEYGGGISFGCGSDGSAAIAARQGTSDSDVVGLSFFTHDSSTSSVNAVEKVRIHDGGSVSFNNGIILGNNLNYNTNNLLDDYEEGTYTPTLHSIGTTTSFTTYGNEQSLSYHKIGNMVTVHGRLRFQTTNFSGEAYISLPFAAANASNTANSGCSAVAFHGVDINGHIGLFIETGNNSSNAWFLIARDDTSWTGATSSNLKSGSYVTFVHTYRAA